MKHSGKDRCFVLTLGFLFFVYSLLSGTTPKLKWEAHYPGTKIINAVENMSLGLDGSLLALGGWDDGTYSVVIAVSPDDGSVRWRTVLGEDTIRFGVLLKEVAGKGVVLTGFADKTALRSPLLSRPFEAIISQNGKEIKYTSWPGDKYKTIFFRDDNCVVRTRDGGLAVLSNFPYQGSHIINFRKWDSNGVFQFETLHDTMPKSNLTVNSLLETKESGFAALYEIGVGIPDSAFIVKYSADGQEVWRNKINNLPRNYSHGAMFEASDGSLAVVTNLFAYNPDTGRAVLQFFSSGGALLHTKSYSALGVMSIRDIERMPDGGYIMAGYTGNSWAVEGDSLQNILIRTDADGNAKWQKVWGQNNVRDLLFTLSVASDGTIYAGGYSAGIDGGYIAAFTEETVRVDDVPDQNILVTPNPAIESFTVHCPEMAAVTVKDVFGRIVLSGIGEVSFPTAHLVSGVYFVEILNPNNSHTSRTIIVSR